MDPEAKNKLSHRALALRALAELLGGDQPTTSHD
jgi:inosine/xanthosine triphosphate pyrophosphatase family protein